MSQKLRVVFYLLSVFLLFSCDDKIDEEAVKVESIIFNENSIAIEKGLTQQLNVSILPVEAVDKKIMWSSSDEQVISVNESGLLNALSEGEAYIKALSESTGLFATCYVTVFVNDEIPEGKVRFKGNISDTGTKVKSQTSRKLLVVYTEKFTEENFIDGLESEEFEIREDNSFSLDINEQKEFILYLMENDKVKGLVGIDSGNGEYWENINSTYLEGVIELGSIPSSSESGLLIAEKTIKDLNVIEGKSDLIQALSRLDDQVRTYVNFVNTGFQNFASPAFVFSSDLVFGEQISIDNLNYAGYQIYAWGKGLDNNMNLYPPSEIQRGNGESFSPSTPIEGECFDPEQDIKFLGFVGGEKFEDLLQGNLPDGEWLLKTIGGDLVANYNLNSILPLRDNKISVPIPSVTINSDSEGVITSISVEWQYYRNGELVIISDVEPLKDRISNLNIEYIQSTDDESMGEDHTFLYNDREFEPDTQQAWSINGANGNAKLHLLVLGYTIDCNFYQLKLSL